MRRILDKIMRVREKRQRRSKKKIGMFFVVAMTKINFKDSPVTFIKKSLNRNEHGFNINLG